MRTRWLVPAVLLLAAGALGADWPQFLGPDRTGVIKGKGLLESWPEGGPPLVWTSTSAGRGYGGMAVVGGTIYMMGARDNTEYVIALDKGGKELWATKIGPVYNFAGNAYSDGPNATPTVDGDRLYGLGSQGILVCLDVSKKGAVVWKKDLPKAMGAEVNPIAGPKGGWGFAWSPLVDGKQLVCLPGGKGGLVAALDKGTGAVLWRSKDAKYQCTYSSPVAAEIGGVRQYVAMTQDGAVGVDAKTGDLLWDFKRESPYADVVCPTPIVSGDKVYLTAWKGNCDLLQLEPAKKKFTVKVVYTKREISNIQGGVVKVGKYLYGFHLKNFWACQDFDTGRLVWRRRGRNGNSVIAAGDRLYGIGERGTVVLLEASPKGYSEKGEFKLPKESAKRPPGGRLWSYPSIADGHLYVRDQELIFCYKIAK
jgi:outer membrane protein assembly factor BamB